MVLYDHVTTVLWYCCSTILGFDQWTRGIPRECSDFKANRKASGMRSLYPSDTDTRVYFAAARKTPCDTVLAWRHAQCALLFGSLL